jgi:pimeloyl-ACP methyl ester carboxylesterase
VRASGGLLSYERVGSGRPLLLIHGIGATHQAWTPILTALAQYHDVIALDLPGFGDSSPLPGGQTPTVSQLAGDVERFCEELDLSQVDVVGNSIGARVALELARRGRAKTVVAISPQGLGTIAQKRRVRQQLRLMHAGACISAPVAGPLARTRIGRTLLFGIATARPWQLNPAEVTALVRSFAQAPGFAKTLEWFMDHDAEGIEEIGCPVTIAWGTRDRILPVSHAKEWTERLPNAELVLLEGLGHVPMGDDPALVARTILETTQHRQSASG